MKGIPRRKVLESGLKLAALTGMGAFRPAKAAGISFDLGSAFGDGSTPAAVQRGSGFFGAQTHFGQFRPGADKLLDLIKGAGIRWIRDEAYWSVIEKEKGVFRFPKEYDAYLAAAQERDIRVLIILDFGNALHTGTEKGGPATETERAAFARYCAEVVRHVRPLGVRHYEIWNEPNASTFWRPKPDPESYALLLETAFMACKDIDPESTVLGCSTAGTDLDFIRRVFAAGGGRFMDAVSFHPYCQPLAPEKKLPADLAKVAAEAPGKPLWLTEFGYPSHAGESGVDEDVQADYAVRAYLLARSSPAVARVFWYDFQNDGEDRGEAEHNFGLVRLDGTPKPAYAAVKTLASLLGDLPPRKREVVGNTYIARFGTAPSGLVAVWRPGGSESVDIRLPDGPCRIVERDGASRAVSAKDSRLELIASESPRYVLPA